MTPKAVLEGALRETFHDAAGRSGRVELEHPLSGKELERFQGQQPAPVPDDIRELLRFTRGFTLLGERVDFRGDIRSEFEPAFCCGIPVRTDGFGSFWVVHVHPGTGEWAPVFFTSQDPPVAVIQSRDLVDFLEELFNLFRPGRASALVEVYRISLDIWCHDRGLRKVAEVRNSPDPTLRVFAGGLQAGAYVADLRSRVLGSGFAWGRFGPDTVVKRHGPDLLFAVERPERRGLFQRLVGGG